MRQLLALSRPEEAEQIEARPPEKVCGFLQVAGHPESVVRVQPSLGPSPTTQFYGRPVLVLSPMLTSLCISAFKLCLEAGTRIILRTLSTATASPRTGWVQELTHPAAVDSSTVMVLVEEVAARKSGRGLCLRNFNYLNCLAVGAWVMDSRWLEDSVKKGRLVYPKNLAGYSLEDLEEALLGYEVNCCA